MKKAKKVDPYYVPVGTRVRVVKTDWMGTVREYYTRLPSGMAGNFVDIAWDDGSFSHGISTRGNGAIEVLVSGLDRILDFVD